MTELLIKEQLDLQRRAAEHSEWREIADQRERHAVLQTLFEAHVKRFEDAQGRAVSQEDLKTLKREFQDQIKEEVAKVHIEIEKSNKAWAETILNGTRTLNAETQVQRMEEQRRFRQQLMLAIFAATLSIIGSLFVLYISTRGH